MRIPSRATKGTHAMSDGFGKSVGPNQNLTGALRASLKVIENTTPPPEPEPSPLLEAEPDSVDEFLDRITNHLIEGKILTDELLMDTINMYRAQAYRWAQEDENKKPRAKRGTSAKLDKTTAPMLDLEF